MTSVQTATFTWNGVFEEEQKDYEVVDSILGEANFLVQLLAVNRHQLVQDFAPLHLQDF